MNKSLVLILCVNCLLVSCVVGPDYKVPNISQKQRWVDEQQLVTPASKPIDLIWWHSFADPRLIHYVEQAAKNNLDVKIAKARIREARAVKQALNSERYPLAAGTATAKSMNLSQQGSELGFFENFPGIDSIQRNQNLYTLGYDALWEVDLFGKTKRKIEAQTATLEQTVEQQRGIVLSTITEVARNYMELRGTQRQLSIAEHNLRLQQRWFQIAKKRYTVGSENAIDLAQVDGQLRSISASLPLYRAQIRANAYQLAVLLGQEPNALWGELERSTRQRVHFKSVPIGLRSEVLKQRPDVRAAERNLAASVAEVGVAVADFYPEFRLVGDMEFQSVNFDSLFNATNLAWTMGPSLRLPIFQGGRIKANIERRKAQTEQAALNYQQTILNALRDAETALARYKKERERNQQLQLAYEVQRDAYRLSKQRYKTGEDDALAVIRAQYVLNQKKIDLIESDTAVIIDSISLYKALGGGWEHFES